MDLRSDPRLFNPPDIFAKLLPKISNSNTQQGLSTEPSRLIMAALSRFVDVPATVASWEQHPQYVDVCREHYLPGEYIQ